MVRYVEITSNGLTLLLCVVSASREAGRVSPVGTVPSVLRGGLRTAVACLTRQQEESQRHKETLGKVSASTHSRRRRGVVPPVAHPAVSLASAGFVAVSQEVQCSFTTPSRGSSGGAASGPQPGRAWHVQGTHGKRICTALCTGGR